MAEPHSAPVPVNTETSELKSTPVHVNIETGEHKSPTEFDIAEIVEISASEAEEKILLRKIDRW